MIVPEAEAGARLTIDTAALVANWRFCAARAPQARCAAVVKGLRDTIGLCRGVAIAPIPAPVREKAQASIRALLKTQGP